MTADWCPGMTTQCVSCSCVVHLLTGCGADVGASVTCPRGAGQYCSLRFSRRYSDCLLASQWPVHPHHRELAKYGTPGNTTPAITLANELGEPLAPFHEPVRLSMRCSFLILCTNALRLIVLCTQTEIWQSVDLVALSHNGWIALASLEDRTLHSCTINHRRGQPPLASVPPP